MRLVVAADTTPEPWKNGGGLTRELLRLPDGDGWGLRISVADIAADGPFSPFPGITRWFAVLEGAGVRLAFPGHAPRDLHPGDAPLRFDGGDAPGCTLLAGMTRDLNVMVRDGFGRAAVEAARPGSRPAVPGQLATGLFALRPLRLHVPGEPSVDVPALSLLWHAAPVDAARPWTLELPDDTADGRAHTSAPPGYWIDLLPGAAP